MEDIQEFIVFRHITIDPQKKCDTAMVFIVRFKFSRLSHKANTIVSIIPMLLISGFPGFNEKIYAVNKKSGFWQGMYQWESKQALEEYKKSFVYRMMKKRAIKESLLTVEYENQYLSDFIENHRSI